MRLPVVKSLCEVGETHDGARQTHERFTVYSQESVVVAHATVEEESACTHLDDGRGIGCLDDSVLGDGTVGASLLRTQA